MRWLDCSTYPPKPTKSITLQFPANAKCLCMFVRDMCCMTQEGKQLLVIADSQDSVSAYSLITGVVEWQIQGLIGNLKEKMVPSATAADEQGHLYVCDSRNKCIHCIDTTSGKYLETLLQYEEDKMPLRIRWCKIRSSLIVTSLKDSVHCIDVVGQSLCVVGSAVTSLLNENWS